jgi:hypothetical protein
MHKSLFIVAALALATTVGCESKPREVGPPPGPRTTSSDLGMPEPIPDQFVAELVDECTQRLIRELPNHPSVRSAPNQLVFGLPPEFENQAPFADGRLRVALQSMRDKLSQNEAFNNNFVVITATQAEGNRVLGAVAGSDTSTASFRDPLQRTADTTRAETYNPAHVYLMTGKFWMLTDQPEGRRSLRLFVRVDHPQSRQQIFSHEFQRNLRWDGRERRWKLAD